MAGGELTTLGRQHSERLGGLVYLDALGDREDDPLADAEWVRLQRQLPAGLLPQARCNPVDRSSFELFRRTSACERGFALPEAELRQMYEDRAGRVGPSRSPAWVGQAIGEGEVVRRDYANIRVPVLVLHNGAQTTEALLTASGYAPRTADERETIDRFVSRSREVFGRSVARLTRHVPDARIVYLPLAGHYLFLTRGTDVVQDIRAFASSLGSRRRD
jgi:pimeloyl-ACP methyl ester carboxylesterase